MAIQGDRMFIDDQMHGQRAIRQIALTAATDYFSAFGGAIDREQLSPGIYVWVWYEHRNPLRSGNPPRAAVVMPFSLDPDDQPEDARCDFGT